MSNRHIYLTSSFVVLNSIHGIKAINECKHNVHVFCNILYVSTKLSPNYSQMNSSDIPDGKLYEEINPAIISLGAPYEVPVPIDAARVLDD